MPKRQVRRFFRKGPDYTRESVLRREPPLNEWRQHPEARAREVAEVRAIEAIERQREAEALTRVEARPAPARRTVTLKTPWGETVEYEVVWP
jgi:hypothetical protein